MIQVRMRSIAATDEWERGLAALPKLLSPAERDRAERFRWPRDRWSYTAAHVLLRAMLAEIHDRAPADWGFIHDQYGRPEIDPAPAGGEPIRFSLTHTHGLAACAVTVGPLPPGVEVGVDAEHVARSLDARSLAERFLHPAEAAWLAAHAEQPGAAFLRLWTLKEAVAKAVGQGLQLGFESFRCTLSPPSVDFYGGPWGPADAWTLWRRDVPPGHALALAIRRPPGLPVTVDYHHYEGTFPWPG